MTAPGSVRRWPAYLLALLFAGYAAGKAAFALQARLGFPSGPPVSEAETAGYFLDPTLAQWLACASGVLGACIAIASVSARGRGVPRPLMLVVLAVMTLAVLGGGGVMLVDGFVGIGVGWQWYHGVVGLVAIALCLEMFRSYAMTTRAAR
ncbi:MULTISPECIES: hypothetical protein [unclassified Kribbella]|uniref:hypothetical protein n=1 Tax=unclassified Kribbella TaxID=2644121 RepID=UPI003408E28C